jgi:hypothetical protein
MVRRRSTVRFRKGAPRSEAGFERSERAGGAKGGANRFTFARVPGRHRPTPQARLGLGLLAAVWPVTAAVWLPSLVLFLAGGVIAGVGADAAFKASIGTALPVAAAHSRGETLVGLVLAAYFGLTVPLVGPGVHPAGHRQGRSPRVRRCPDRSGN